METARRRHRQDDARQDQRDGYPRFQGDAAPQREQDDGKHDDGHAERKGARCDVERLRPVEIQGVVDGVQRGEAECGADETPTAFTHRGGETGAERKEKERRAREGRDARRGDGRHALGEAGVKHHLGAPAERHAEKAEIGLKTVHDSPVS